MILFAVLEIIAFNFILRYNDQQRHMLGDQLLEVTGVAQGVRMGIKNYLYLGRKNDLLQTENTALHQKLDVLTRQLECYEGIALQDSVKNFDALQLLASDSFRFIPGRVLRSSTNSNYNYLTLDRGSLQGIRVGMGVISTQGVAGRIIRVSDNYSLALSPLNMSFSLSTFLLSRIGTSRQSFLGIYEWAGGNPRRGELTFIPESAEVQTGDSVITSGHSAFFPHGIMVGRVSDTKTGGEQGFRDVEIELATDFEVLERVYIIEALHMPAMDSLAVNLSGNE